MKFILQINIASLQTVKYPDAYDLRRLKECLIHHYLITILLDVDIVDNTMYNVNLQLN